ncbi:MAG: AAA family ATPase, partial [Candidatus Hecatellaceae archaeon]
MRLIVRKLKLQNIRSHVDSEVTFGEGFNCVVGGVGAGKTSILLAIHFALFGEPLYRSYDYLLREDRNHGLVSLEFEQAGKIYRVVRGLTRDRRGRITQNPDEVFLMEEDKKIAWSKISAVQDQL